MPTKVTTPEERINLLRARLLGSASTMSRAEKRLSVSPAQNLLFGVALHAAARHAKGLPLSSLEERMMKALRVVAADDEIAEYGKVYTDFKNSGRSADTDGILPKPILDFNEDLSYNDDDMIRDARALAPDIQAVPSNAIVDVSKLGKGTCLDSDEYIQAIGNAGTGVTVFANSKSKGAVGTDDARVPARYVNCKLWPHRFNCIKSSGDGMFNGKDEIYWCWGFGADSQAKKDYKTSEFGSIKSGTSRNFSETEFLHDGRVHGILAGHIQCWEADDSSGGWYNKLRDTLKVIAEECVELAVTAVEEQDDDDMALAAALLGLVSIVAGLINALLAWLTNDDDLVCERTFGFTVDAIRELAGMGEKSFIFDGGGQGKHELWIKATCGDWQGGPEPRTIMYGQDSHGVDTWGVLPGGSTPFDSYDDMSAIWYAPLKKTLAVFTTSNNNLCWSLSDDFRWTPPTVIGLITFSQAPALIVFNGRVFCVTQGASNNVICMSSQGDLAIWSPAVQVGKAFLGGIGLAEYNGKLYCVLQTDESSVRWYESDDGVHWTEYQKISIGASPLTMRPTLCSYGDGLHLFICGPKNSLYWLKYTSGSWGHPSEIIDGDVYSAPSAVMYIPPASHLTKELFCAWRDGGDTGGSLWHIRYDGAWSQKERLPSHEKYFSGPRLYSRSSSIWILGLGI